MGKLSGIFDGGFHKYYDRIKKNRNVSVPVVARNAYFDTGLCFETFGLSIVILPRFR